MNLSTLLPAVIEKSPEIAILILLIWLVRETLKTRERMAEIYADINKSNNKVYTDMNESNNKLYADMHESNNKLYADIKKSNTEFYTKLIDSNVELAKILDNKKNALNAASDRANDAADSA